MSSPAMRHSTAALDLKEKARNRDLDTFSLEHSAGVKNPSVTLPGSEIRLLEP